ncbi:MAG: peptide chain release factor N(5)-glutamine methyltransferase [Chloroflexi bacterium]|nr:peptide chain release factor N(5)-glutamine methyltransferase [Chloroflexota bacterium]
MREALSWATDLLASIEERDVAQLEAEVLLCHQLRISRAQLHAHLDESLDLEMARRYGFLVERRAAHEPVAYIVGHKEFFGLDFVVDRRVLIPRPETELLVETVLSGLGQGRGVINHAPTLADVGTGSGAIAISLAVRLPQARIFAADASTDALEVAAINCTRHGVQDRVTLLQGDLLEPVPSLVDVIVANLPYIPSDQLAILPPDIRDYEPLSALDGGADGLDRYRRLFQQSPDYLHRPGLLVAEFGIGQGPAIRHLAAGAFPAATIQLLPDLAGIDRVVLVSTA